jgi:hypothetical protein
MVEDRRLRGRDTHEEARCYQVEKSASIIPHRKMESIPTDPSLGKVNHHEFTSYFLS